MTDFDTEKRVELAYAERSMLVRHNKDCPRTGSCGHKLASDNSGPMCGPCTRKALRDDENMLLEDTEKMFHKQGRDTVIVDISRLKEHMKARDIRVAWLAKRTRIAEGYIYGWVRTGTAPITGAKMIADTMGLTLDDLRSE